MDAVNADVLAVSKVNCCFPLTSQMQQDYKSGDLLAQNVVECFLSDARLYYTPGSKRSGLHTKMMGFIGSFFHLVASGN
jgi:hypothetical protein